MCKEHTTQEESKKMSNFFHQSSLNGRIERTKNHQRSDEDEKGKLAAIRGDRIKKMRRIELKIEKITNEKRSGDELRFTVK